MTTAVADLGAADRLHTPPPGDPSLPRHKEWHHFNLVEDQAGLDAIVNLSLTGDPHEPGAGYANLILLTHEAGRGWRGDIDLHDAAALRGRTDRVDLGVGLSRLWFEDGRYRLETALRDGSVRASLQFAPLAEPLMVWKETPVGSRHLNWLVVPSLGVSGEIVIEGRPYDLCAARAYHDHNWGVWRWGEDFGWDWGFCADACEIGGQSLSLVYHRTTDRSGTRVQEHTLALWRGRELGKVFSRRMLQARRIGRFVGEVRRRPPALALLRHDRVRSVPERIVVEGRDGEDWIEMTYVVDAALQIAIPNEMNFGIVELNETMGWLEMQGVVGGSAFSCRRRTCFEIVC